MNRNLPDTSISAYKQAEPMIAPHHKKIIAALNVLGVCIYEKIADYLKMDKHQIGRRLSELESLQIVCKPGTKAPTKTGRLAYEYSLTEYGKSIDTGEIKIPNPVGRPKKEITQTINPLFDNLNFETK